MAQTVTKRKPRTKGAGYVRQQVAEPEARADGTIPINAPRTRRHLDDMALKLAERVRDDPVWFAREILQHKQLPGEPTLAEDPNRSWELDEFQVDLLEACADVWRKLQGKPTKINHDGKSFITARSGHGPGKTHTAALVAHWFNFAFMGRIVATAPKFKQLTTRLWPAFRKVAMRAQPWYRAMLEINDTTVNWGANLPPAEREKYKHWTMLAETATQPENLAGHHESFQLVLVEEASGIPEALVPVIMGALSSGRLQILFQISNPTKRTGAFAASHLSVKEADNFFRYHITLDKARRVSRDWASKIIRKYGEKSPIVQVRVHGNFPTDDPNQLIATQWIMDAIVRERAADGSRPKLRISIDVADGGDNETIVTAAKHYQSFMHVVEQRTYSFESHVAPLESAQAGVAMFERWGGIKNVDDFVPDAGGVGAGTAGLLMKWNYNVVPHVGGQGSSNPAMFRNRRVQNYMGLRNDFRDGLIVIADDCCKDASGNVSEDDMEELIAQLCSIRSKPDNDRVEDLWTKKEMRDEGIKSPDRADSLSMQKSSVTPSLVGGEQFGGQVEVFAIPSTALTGLFRG